MLECVHDIYQLSLGFAEVFRFICGLRILGCQIALVLNGKLVDTVGDMLVDLTQSDLRINKRFLARDIVDFCDVLCASVSVEHVRRDLELTAVVQHCPNLVYLRRARLILLCLSPSLLQDLLTLAAIGFRLHLHCLLDRGERDDILNRMPETFDAPSSGCFVDNPDNSLIESISLFEGLFKRHAHNLGSHRFLYKM